MSDGARAALAKEREAMAIKLGFNSTERERVDLALRAVRNLLDIAS